MKTLADAELAAQEGGQRALDHAEELSPGFAQAARDFLERFLRTVPRGGKFTSEEVVELAKIGLVAAPDARAWGPVFRAAARDGLITQTGEPYRRRYGNGSVAFKWARAH